MVGTEGPNQFPVYGEEGVGDVDPNRGNFMLRLYTPSLISENSNRGVTGVFQVFTPETDELTVSLRIFSFEPRGDDIVRIDVQDLAGNSLGRDVTFSDPDSGQDFFRADGTRPPRLDALKRLVSSSSMSVSAGTSWIVVGERS